MKAVSLLAVLVLPITVPAQTRIVGRVADAAVFSIDPLLIAGERAYSVASSSVLRDLDIRLRPRDSSQRLLSLTPGLVIAQHAGGGKAEQIFLRGFDADHGTDVAISVDGMPVNMVSHAHGQGYADLHFVLPEIVARIETRKGIHDARDGDFATAGAVAFTTLDRIEAPTLITRTGSFGTRQLTSLLPFDIGARSTGYLAAGWQSSDGPFDAPQHHRRTNLYAKATTTVRGAELVASASAFDAVWDASGQIPQRAVDSGMIRRFGAIDGTEGGSTARYDAMATLRGPADAPVRWTAAAYLTQYRFRLYSNFTFFLNDSINGDGIEQSDRRTLAGGRLELQRAGTVAGQPALWSAGLGLRNDLIDAGLYNQSNRARTGTKTDDRINESHVSSWLEQELQLSSRSRLSLSLRADAFRFAVTDRIAAPTPVSTARWSGIVSPRARFATDLNSVASLFASAGWGFHSNDARDVVRAKRDAITLPRAFGTEVGARRSWTNASLGIAAWLTDLQSELVYVGDEGTTEPNGATRRIGIDAEARVRILPWLWADADLNVARGRFREAPDGEDRIPLAPSVTSTGGLVARSDSPWSGGLRYRYIGARAADEANEVRARQSQIWEGFAGWQRGRLRLSMSIDNLFDVAWNEAQFATTSRLRDEAQPVTELHFTPGAPRTLALSAEFRF